MLPVLPRGFPLPMKEVRSKGQDEESESSCERKNVGEEVEDDNDNVNAMNNTEMIDKLNKESTSKPMIPFIDIEVNSVCSESWL